MQIIRDASGAAAFVLSSEREHILTDCVTGLRGGINVCRLVPPLDLLHGVLRILTERSAMTHIDAKEKRTLCRLSHYV